MPMNQFKEKIDNPIENWPKDMDKSFYEIGRKMANKYIKRSSVLIIREMQIKSIIRKSFLSVCLAKLKNFVISSIGETIHQSLLHNCRWNIKLI